MSTTAEGLPAAGPRPLSSELVLDARAVRREFGGLVAVNDVDFTIPRHSIVSLIGPNGAGKTTFFNILTGLYKPTRGQILFERRGASELTSIAGVVPHKIAQYGMARTFQNIRLFQSMTAEENVMVGMHQHLKSGAASTILRLPGQRREERQARETARELLDYVGIGGRGDWYAKHLPYGDQRRLEVARALAVQPKLLLLDEPTAGMNPQETLQFTGFVGRLRDERGLTILLIEHDMQLVMDVSERITVLEYGAKISEGTPDEVRHDPRVIEAYLGKGATEGASS